MNRIKKLLLVSAIFSSCHVYANVDIKLHNDLEYLIVNGERVGLIVSKSGSKELDNGVNQIVVRVSKLIGKNAEFEKFNSEPIVLTFNASDVKLSVNPDRIIKRVDTVGDFDKKPSVTVINSKGEKVDVHQGLLKYQGGFSRDFVKELAVYNKDHNYQFGFVTIDKPIQTPIITTPVSDSAIILIQADYLRLALPLQNAFHAWLNEPNRKSSTSNELILIKADYLRLSNKQKQTFLTWVNQQ